MPSPKVLPKVAPYQSCIACFRGDTETCFGMEGSFTGHVELHLLLGIPEDQAVASTALAFRKHGIEIEGRLSCLYVICRGCAEQADLPPLAPLKEGVKVDPFTLSTDSA